MQVGVAQRDALGDLLRAAGLRRVRARATRPPAAARRSAGSGLAERQIAKLPCSNGTRPAPASHRRGIAALRYAPWRARISCCAAAAAAKPFAGAGEASSGCSWPIRSSTASCSCARSGRRRTTTTDDDDVPELGWIAVDGDGLALADERRVQEAAMLAALCETAEEAALVPDAADDRARRRERALALAGDEQARLRRGARRRRTTAALAAAAGGDGLASRAPATSTSWRDAARALGAAAGDLQLRAGRALAAASRATPATRRPARARRLGGARAHRAAGAPERFERGDRRCGAGAISAFAERRGRALSRVGSTTGGRRE